MFVCFVDGFYFFEREKQHSIVGREVGEALEEIGVEENMRKMNSIKNTGFFFFFKHLMFSLNWSHCCIIIDSKPLKLTYKLNVFFCKLPWLCCFITAIKTKT